MMGRTTKAAPLPTTCTTTAAVAMRCDGCGGLIGFYAHQHYRAQPPGMAYFHPECCPNCPERHRTAKPQRKPVTS